MRSILLFFTLLVGAVGLSAGCSRSDDAQKADPSASSPPSPAWASDAEPEPSAVEPAPPIAADRSEAAASTSPPAQPPAGTSEAEEPTQQPKPIEPDAKEPSDQDQPPPARADQEPPQPPPNAFSSEPGAAADSRPPSLRNPLRDAPPPAGSENPMRPPAAPLPDSTIQGPPQPTPAPPADLPGPSEPSTSADASSPGTSLSAASLPGGGSPQTTTPAHLSNGSSSRPAGTASGEAGGEKAEETFDPVKENGPIFEGWPQPRLAIVITGREDGYIEPCGCAGLNKMKGGLSRRHTMIQSLHDKGWPVVSVDVGGLVKGYGPQAEIKYQRTVDAMRMMGYRAIGFGTHDLQLPVPELVSATAEPSPFVSANVGLFGFDANLNARTKIIDAGGMKIGVTAVLGKKYQGQINNQEIELAAAEDALAPIVTRLRKTCNLLILLAYATKDESLALGKKFPDFQLVVTAGGPPEPPREPIRISDTNSLLIEVGEKGADAIVVGLYDDPENPLRYQRVPLDSRFKASKDMHRIMAVYQEELRRRGLEGLGIRPVSHPQSELCGSFVGSEKCKSCHEESYRVWKKSDHAKAWKTLVDADPPRNFDPECISCHVTGWHPTRYFPYKSGFLSEQETPEMINVGCETCHGPGGAHCDAEDGSDLALQEKLYKAIRVTKEEARSNLAKMCQNCHDLDNSPDFNFETCWPKVEHYEDD